MQRRPTGPATRWLVALAGLLAATGVLAVSRTDHGRSLPRSATIDVGGLRFADVTDVAGIGIPYSDDELSGDDDMSSPIAVADLVGDAAPDLYVSRRGKANSLYRNDGDGHFTDVAAETGVSGPDPTVGSGPAAIADFDGDGCTDIYVTALGTGPDAMYHNDCKGHFVDVTSSSGIGFPPANPAMGAQHHGVATADIDLDGDLDLFVASWDVRAFGRITRNDRSVCELRDELTPTDPSTNRSRLFLNDGHGRFTDATATMALDLTAVAAFTPVFADVDEDGWPDLAITGDGCTSRLFRNDSGHRFVDITRAAGVGTDENGMGSVVQDFDGDGHLDWFVTSIFAPTRHGRCASSSPLSGCSGNRLYLGDGTGRFRDATDRFGVRDGAWGWGAVLEDFAGIGRPQLLQVNGYRSPRSSAPDAPVGYLQRFTHDADRFWFPSGGDRTPRFVDSAAAVHLEGAGVDHAVVTADFDGDGEADVVTAGSDGPPRFWRTDRPTGRHWLTIRLDDPTHPANRSGIGARVSVTIEAGRRPVTGWISTDGSYESRQLPEMRLGLSTTTKVERIEVRWPGDPEAQVVTDATADQVLVIERPSTD